VESVVDYAIYMLDPSGRVASWNAGAQRMKGHAAMEVLGQHFSIFFTPEDVAAGKPEHELAIARAEGRFEDEILRVRKDGTSFWANVVVTPLRSENGELVGFAKVTRDLTKERQARKMEIENQLKDAFLATVSHELRTPLTAILGWTKLLKKQRLEANVVNAIDVITRNAEAQVKLVDDLLDVSRIVNGKFRVEMREADLVSIVAEAIDVVKPTAIAKCVALDFEEQDEPCLLVGDAERLRQVFWNILWNAVKFTPRNGMVRVSMHHEGAQVTVAIVDTGKGIAPDFLPYVFERFKQADQSIIGGGGGLGLGLALVRHIVELHGGWAMASSDGVGRGARFDVTLPIRAVRPTSVPEPLSRARPLAGFRVLIVDDEADSRELISAVLAHAGADVQTAGSAADAIGSLPRFRPHLVVSDIGMPVEDGYSLMRRVRALAQEEGGAVPSIALTAYRREEDKARALAAGFTAHIGKPVDPDDLVTAVQNLANA
jgi:PAS domain S-box-containing protein